MILDTNALSARAEGVAAVEFPLRSAGRLVVPCVVPGEYYFGIRQSRHRRRYEHWLRRYLPMAEIANVTHATADLYADIRRELRRAGTPIPPGDAWIAALARQHDLPVPSNDAHFDVVERVERIAFRGVVDRGRRLGVVPSWGHPGGSTLPSRRSRNRHSGREFARLAATVP